MKNLLKSFVLVTLYSSILFSCKEEQNVNPTVFGFVQASSSELKGVENVPQLLMGILPDSCFLVTPTPGNQGMQGSCTSWATGFAMGSFFMKKGGGYTGEADHCSPAYLFNQVKYIDCSGGSTFPANLNMMKNKGVCTMEEMPYNQDDCSIQPNTGQHSAAIKNKILKWEVVNKRDITNIKSLLYSGLPVMIAVNVDENFDNLQPPYIWKLKGGMVRGGHAITVTGYNNRIKAFKVQNSWGSNWKDRGYLWIDYDFFPNAVIDNECYVAYPLKSDPSDNLAQGLVLYLKCDGNAQDASGNNNHGTVGGATLVTDRNGNANKAYQFGGYNNPNFIKVSNNSTLQFSNSFTFATWVKINNKGGMDGYGQYSTTASQHCLFAKDWDRDKVHALLNYSTKTDYGGFYTGVWSSSNSVSSNIAYEEGQWMHLVYAYSGSKLKLYKNGALVISTTGSLNFIPSNTQDLYFGRFSSKWYPLDGVLDDIRIYNRALTDSEAQRLYQL